MHWPRVQANFDRSPKILVQAIRNLSLKRRIVATLDQVGLYADHTLNVLYCDHETYDIRYILAILNSSLSNYIFRKKYIDINIKGEYLLALPIRTIDSSDCKEKACHDRLVSLVEDILQLHKRLVSARINNDETFLQHQIVTLDQQIDKLVYELYELTEDEVKVVEEMSK